MSGFIYKKNKTLKTQMSYYVHMKEYFNTVICHCDQLISLYAFKMEFKNKK